MKPIEKAAQQASHDIMIHCANRPRPNQFSLEEIITKHLAPIKDELDAKDKLLSEAREWVLCLTQSCECENYSGVICKTCTKQQDWLARVKE